VDGNVERVMARLFAVETPMPAAKPDLTRLAAALTPPHRPGDHAQAVMDLGATICTPRKPACILCPWSGDCLARAAGLAETLPRKAAKPERPSRHGRVWIARRADGAWLLERRPAKGLLGGMLGWPGTDWDRGTSTIDPPLAADWRGADGQVRHTFTHFDLYLDVEIAVAETQVAPLRGQFIAPQDFGPGDLPTVMRKAFDLALAAFSA
jgi:A/G-specific adenine glycosylase